MAMLSRLLAPAVFAVGLGLVALSPAPAHAQSGDDLVRVLVDVADVMFRSGTPYYRNSDYSRDDRLVVVRNRYGQPTYYRQVRRGGDYGHQGRQLVRRSVKCNKHGKCKATYYDPRHDRDRYSRNDRYDRYDRSDRYRWQASQWRDRDDGRDRDDD